MTAEDKPNPIFILNEDLWTSLIGKVAPSQIPAVIDAVEKAGWAKRPQFPGLNRLRDECHSDSIFRGWWDMGTTADLDHKAAVKIALIHSEVSEALEGIRKHKRDEHLIDRPSGEVELVDALIRIFDLAGALGYDLDGAYIEKRAYNKRRHDHNIEARNQPGGKKF